MPPTLPPRISPRPFYNVYGGTQEHALAGRHYVTSAVAGLVVGSLLSPEPAAPESPLTEREVEIASLVGRGLENSEIADRLCIAEVTVRTHLLNILRKLELKNRVPLPERQVAVLRPRKCWMTLRRPLRGRENAG